MKNLMKLASCGNSAKFVWQEELKEVEEVKGVGDEVADPGDKIDPKNYENFGDYMDALKGVRSSSEKMDKGSVGVDKVINLAKEANGNVSLKDMAKYYKAKGSIYK